MNSSGERGGSLTRNDRRGRRLRWAAASAGLALILTGLVLGCGSSRDRYEILSFLFDGVPDPDAPPPPGPTAAPDGGDLRAPGAAVPDDGRSRHKPWVENRCRVCHDEIGGGRKSRFGSTGMAIGWSRCAGCHSTPEEVGENAVVIREGEWQHGPVARGDCRTCHAAHWSPHPHLLRKERQEETCRSCHTDLGERSGTMAELDCVACHDPHIAGDQADLLLRGGIKGSCGICHVPRSGERPWLHGPVNSGDCGRCHDAHGGEGTRNHVFRPIRVRCFGCHRREEVPLEVHCDESRECDDCHDPHSAPAAADLFLRERIARTDGEPRAFETRLPTEDAATGEIAPEDGDELPEGEDEREGG